jgi:hypothetical protein
MSSRQRLAQVTVALAVSSLVLAGCERSIGLDDPIQVRVADGELQVRVCMPTEGTSILVQARGEGDWEDLWMASGTVDFERGDVISASTLEDVFSVATLSVNPSLVSGDDVAVILYKESGNLAGSFELNDPAIAGEWIGTLNNPESSC